MDIVQRRAALNRNRRPIPTEHPRLFGGPQRLIALAEQRPQAYRRMREYLERPELHDDMQRYYGIQAQIFGLAFASVVENDQHLARRAVELVLEHYIDQPVQLGHVPFGTSMARCAIVYDLCHRWWHPDEQRRLFEYADQTIHRNIDEEPSCFHNGWYGYKNWGFGVYAYATMHEDPQAPQILRDLEEEYLRRAAPSLKMAGTGGGWAEGYYIHYWLHEWLFFCDIALQCDGADYFATVPEFYANRAIASMFEMYPALEEGTFRPVPMGDGGGRRVNNERDKALAARRILVNYHRDDPAHQAVHAFNEQTRIYFDHNAYMDFLWHDQTVKLGDLASFKRSHYSPGAGFVYARESWKQDSTYFFFHCGRRFTAHQHLDNGHFVIFKHKELLGDGGHYDTFGGEHDVNYLMRTIAHNAILVYDPAETWPRRARTTPKGMRAGAPGVNDGGQAYPWSGTIFHHNGGARDVNHYYQQPELMDIARILAYRDQGDYVYVAGDCTRSYSPRKLDLLTRQIVFLRPGTFIVFDRIRATDPSYRKTFVLQAMKVPTTRGEHMVIDNGAGRLFVQTLLPTQTDVQMYHGDTLYTYRGMNHPFHRDTGPAPECRVEISSKKHALFDCFLHVLTATDTGTEQITPATARIEGADVLVQLDRATLRLPIDRLGGDITLNGKTEPLAGQET